MQPTKMYLLCVCVHVYAYICTGTPRGQKWMSDPPGNPGSCELPNVGRCCELKLGPQKSSKYSEPLNSNHLPSPQVYP